MCGVLKKGCMGHKIAACLVLVGALNWGLVGLFDFNLVMKLFGSWAWLERLVYILVGLAAVLELVGCRCKACKAGKGSGGCGGSCSCGMKKDMPKEEAPAPAAPSASEEKADM